MGLMTVPSFWMGERKTGAVVWRIKVRTLWPMSSLETKRIHFGRTGVCLVSNSGKKGAWLISSMSRAA